LREAGLLIAVFAWLDAAIVSPAVPFSGTALASLEGIVFALVGIHFDPEV
jgi:hypothetical protein